MELTTIQSWARKNYDCGWGSVPMDYIYFSYPSSPKVILRLVTHGEFSGGGGAKGKVQHADGSIYQTNTGMSVVEKVLIRGEFNSVITIGGE